MPELASTGAYHHDSHHFTTVLMPVMSMGWFLTTIAVGSEAQYEIDKQHMFDRLDKQSVVRTD
jgi:hypothetical protein